MLKDQENKTEDNSGIGLSLVFELGYVIAIPLVVCALGGRAIDRIFETSPLFLLLGIFSSMIISAYFVYYKMQQITK